MHLRDFRHVPANGDQSFTVTLTLNVEDARALWGAAAEKAMRAPGTTLADVLDTIGPREDPSIADCIAMLAAPAAIAGCALEDFSVEADPAGVQPAELVGRVTEACGPGLRSAARG
jgi:hypothetical protein